MPGMVPVGIFPPSQPPTPVGYHPEPRRGPTRSTRRGPMEVLSGPPMPNPRIPLNDLRRGWAADSAEVRAAVERVLASGWYVQGPEHAAFERELADYVGTRHAAGVASGTDALCLAMLALGLGEGSEILTAANAGGYTSCAAAQIGARVTYADVDAATSLVTADTVADALGPDTRAVVVTHLYGNVADVEAIAQVCRPKGIAIIEDCAQAIGGADGKGRSAGSLGDVAALSFYPTKNLGAAGDGGAVATNDDEIHARLKSLRQYGWSPKYHVSVPGGRNSRLDEIQAAILRFGLRRTNELNERRREIVGRYAEATSQTSISMVTGNGCETVGHLAVVRHGQRDRLRQHLAAHGVDTDIHYPVLDPDQPGLPQPSRVTRLDVSRRVVAEIVTIPCFPEMTDAEVERVSRALQTFEGGDSE